MIVDVIDLNINELNFSQPYGQNYERKVRTLHDYERI